LSLKAQHAERRGTYAFLGLSFAFLVAHAYYLFTYSGILKGAGLAIDQAAIRWVVKALLPVLVALFTTLAVVSFFRLKVRAGIFKLFFGLTLFCCLYLIGDSWPLYLQCLLTLGWLVAWFQTEFAT
jgi:hypothetical protein